jgi:hypothetical protein
MVGQPLLVRCVPSGHRCRQSQPPSSPGLAAHHFSPASKNAKQAVRKVACPKVTNNCTLEGLHHPRQDPCLLLRVGDRRVPLGGRYTCLPFLPGPGTFPVFMRLALCCEILSHQGIRPHFAVMAKPLNNAEASTAANLTNCERDTLTQYAVSVARCCSVVCTVVQSKSISPAKPSGYSIFPRPE